MNTIPRTSGIYKITCTPTGKIYIGSAVNLWQRCQDHRWKLRIGKHYNKYLQSAWNKYGEGDFTFIVLELVLAPFLLEREQYYLDKLKPFDRDKGFNSYPKAGSPYGRKVSDESRRKMSAAQKGRAPLKVKRYVVVSPDGNEMEIINLRAFCREHDLTYSNMYRLTKGMSRHTHKGWRCRIPNPG